MKQGEDEKSKVVRYTLNYPDGSYAGYVVFDGKYSKVYNEKGEILFEVEGLFPPRRRKVNYQWIEKVLEKGMHDCRKRFILYVASRYLVNVKGLDENEAVKQLEEFYSKSGGKVYESWLKSVVRGVKTKKLLPWSLKRIEEKDKEMFEIITKILNE
ncbi:DNA primase noncatalytic subunit PriX [Stygiolobus sp. RP850M]|uniref:DNA primase noncatalytic subunit PriX n=1 Tax=Stygiolobus sp. RP850M TaxID=3133137 RepID=UPI00307E74B8